MKIHGQPHRSIEADHTRRIARIVDQTFLPHQVAWRELETMEDAVEAIKVMRVRGAPLIGAPAGLGLFFAPVSYSHMTLPTKREGEIPFVDVALKTKR